ncbi:MAG: glycine cleavage system aminomethyltransferase GcvT [Leptolyngbyaceae cyanobacterium SM2_5_2]|nr:glycine cleavage system aminomethyltransferase GcvT [Leptolyngbyaceae cyanobacterium SM2_5_2]
MPLHSPLHSRYTALQARLTEFAGWEMPVQFIGIRQEHEAVRTQAGLFDISHMGKFELQGRGVLAALQRLVPSNLARLLPGKAQYTVLLNPQGGIVDDLIFYFKGCNGDGRETVAAIVNAATTDKDKAWLLEHLASADIELVDYSRERVLLSLQGPQAVDMLQAVTAEDLTTVSRFGHVEGTVLGKPAFLARTGYTGEDGFEIMTDPTTGVALWDALLDEGATPCGLGARDTLRLEAAMALYGQDIDDTTSPLEAGLGWLVHLEEVGDFIGRRVLEQQKQEGVTRRLVGLTLTDRHIARHDYPVMQDVQPIGIVTSGTFSPTLNIPIALAYVPTALAKMGQALAVDIRGKQRAAKVVKRPFYRAGG